MKSIKLGKTYFAEKDKNVLVPSIGLLVYSLLHSHLNSDYRLIVNIAITMNECLLKVLLCILVKKTKKTLFGIVSVVSFSRYWNENENHGLCSN